MKNQVNGNVFFRSLVGAVALSTISAIVMSGNAFAATYKYQIVNHESHLCVQRDGSIKVGRTFTLETCDNNSWKQSFVVRGNVDIERPSGLSEDDQLVTMSPAGKSGIKFCLAPKNGSSRENVEIVLRKCNQSIEQIWLSEDTPSLRQYSTMVSGFKMCLAPEMGEELTGNTGVSLRQVTCDENMDARNWYSRNVTDD